MRRGVETRSEQSNALKYSVVKSNLNPPTPALLKERAVLIYDIMTLRGGVPGATGSLLVPLGRAAEPNLKFAVACIALRSQKKLKAQQKF